MTEPRVLATLADQWAVPVIRSRSPEDAEETALVLAGQGFPCVELTYSTPDVLAVIARLVDMEGLVVGLGTITTAAQAEEGLAAGAEFLVSFANPPGLLAAGAAAGVPTIPGAFSPSEILAAVTGGASAVKLFPAHLAGPQYLRDLAAVLPDVRVLATGGVGLDAEALRPWAASGAFAVGVGSSLGTVERLGETGLRRRAAMLKDAVKDARGG